MIQQEEFIPLQNYIITEDEYEREHPYQDRIPYMEWLEIVYDEWVYEMRLRGYTIDQ